MPTSVTTAAAARIGDQIISMIAGRPDATIENIADDLGDVLIQTDQDGTTRYPASARLTVAR